MFERRPQHSGKRRPQLLELDRKWAIKFGLRFVAFVLVIVGVISFGVVASYYKGSGDGYSGFTIDTVLPFILVCAPLCQNSSFFEQGTGTTIILLEVLNLILSCSSALPSFTTLSTFSSSIYNTDPFTPA